MYMSEETSTQVTRKNWFMGITCVNRIIYLISILALYAFKYMKVTCIGKKWIGGDLTLKISNEFFYLCVVR